MSHKLESKASAEASQLGFIRRQFTKPKALPAGSSLTNQTAIVTGSNVGLGYEACRQFLGLGLSHLIMGVRSQAKGDAAAAKLRKEFPSATVSVWLVDLQSYESIQAFAEKCATLPKINIVVLNAGLMSTSYSVVPSTQHEISLQVNYLSTVLLALLLIPILKAKKDVGEPKSKPPVLSIVGSDLAYGVKMDTKGPIIAQFDNQKAFNGFPWYSKTKLLILLFVAKIAELVSADDVIVNVSNPGMTKGTDFFNAFPAIFRKFMGILQLLLARTAAVGAAVYVHATVAAGEESHGSFVSDWTIKPYPKLMYSKQGQAIKEQLWKETIAELDSAGAGKVVEELVAPASKADGVAI